MKSRHLFSFAAFSFPDLEPLSEENAKSPGQLITQEAECESLFQAKSSLASSWVCVCFSSFFLSLGTFYLPYPVCSPGLLYPFCFLQKTYEGYEKEEKNRHL